MILAEQVSRETPKLDRPYKIQTDHVNEFVNKIPNELELTISAGKEFNN